MTEVARLIGRYHELDSPVETACYSVGGKRLDLTDINTDPLRLLVHRWIASK